MTPALGRSNSHQSPKQLNADIQEIIPFISVRKPMQNQDKCESLFGYSNEQAFPSVEDDDQQLYIPEYFTSSAAEAQASYNYY